MFLRFAPDMNDPARAWGPEHGNAPADFIRAWRRIHDLFRTSGATNVVWVWSPSVSAPSPRAYDPGPEFMDWAGVRSGGKPVMVCDREAVSEEALNDARIRAYVFPVDALQDARIARRVEAKLKKASAGTGRLTK
jgi:hypothetical protein